MKGGLRYLQVQRIKVMQFSNKLSPLDRTYPVDRANHPLCNWCMVCVHMQTNKSFWQCHSDNVSFCFVSVIIDHPWFISRFIGNSLWLIALVYYIYITFLGYSGKLKKPWWWLKHLEKSWNMNKKGNFWEEEGNGVWMNE